MAFYAVLKFSETTDCIQDYVLFIYIVEMREVNTKMLKGNVFRNVSLYIEFFVRKLRNGAAFVKGFSEVNWERYPLRVEICDLSVDCRSYTCFTNNLWCLLIKVVLSTPLITLENCVNLLFL